MINLFGYIDPATTALVWQILAGAFIAFSVVLGAWWTKVSIFFRSLFVKSGRVKSRQAGVWTVVVVQEGDLIADIERAICTLNDKGEFDISVVLSGNDDRYSYMAYRYGVEILSLDDYTIIRSKIHPKAIKVLQLESGGSTDNSTVADDGQGKRYHTSDRERRSG